MFPSSAFPTEIYEHIIDFCAGDGVIEDFSHYLDYSVYRQNAVTPAILRTCSLVCRTWQPRSRIHIYSDVFLTKESHLRLLLSSLRVRPSNGGLIRRLGIFGKNPEGYGPPEKATGQNWVTLVVLQLSPMLCNLQSLYLSDINTSILHPSFLKYISQLRTITTLKLSKVIFNSFEQCARLISAFSHLSRLQLSTERQNHTAQPHLLVRQRSRRVRLSVAVLRSEADSERSAIMRWLLVTSSPKTLVRLFLEPFRPAQGLGLRMTNDLLQACGESLLDLSFGIHSYGQSDNIDIRPNTGLRFVRITVYGTRDQEQSKSWSTVSLAETLSQTTSFRMEVVHLVFCRLTVQDVRNADWGLIDAALSLPQYAGLSEVELDFRIAERNKIKEHLDTQKLLPQLHIRGIITL